MIASPILKNIDWIVAHGPGFTVECLRCGRKDSLPLPMPCAALPWFTRGYQELHRFCAELPRNSGSGPMETSADAEGAQG